MKSGKQGSSVKPMVKIGVWLKLKDGKEQSGVYTLDQARMVIDAAHNTGRVKQWGFYTEPL